MQPPSPIGPQGMQPAPHVGSLGAPAVAAGGGRSRASLVIALALLLLAGLLVARALDATPIARLRMAGFDVMQRLAAAEPHDAGGAVVILDIDERSLAAHGQWPWPRDRIAHLVAELDRAGARVIGFDILFPERDRLSPEDLVARFAVPPADRDALTARLIDPDAALTDAIAAADAPVVLASALVRSRDRSLPTGEAAGLVLPPSLATEGPSPMPWLLQADGVVGNISAIEVAATGRGFLTNFVDGDGVVRRLPLVARAGGNLQPGLVLELARLGLGADAATVVTDPVFGIAGVRIGDRLIRTDASGAIWLRATADGAPIADRIAAGDLLAGLVPEDRLAGHVVLIGSTALGLNDQVTAAGGNVRAGVEVLADGAAMVLAGDPLYRPGYAPWLEGLAALVLGLAFLYRMSLHDALRTAIMGVAAAVLLAGAAVVALAAGDILLDPTFPILSALIFAAIAGYWRAREVERGRELARRALAEADTFIHRLVDATFDAVVAVDRTGRLLFANRAAAALPVLGDALKLGADINSLLHRAAEAGPLGQAGFVPALAAEPGTVDLVAMDADTTREILLEVTATPLRDDPDGTVVLVLRDVTARRAAQRRIETQAEDLRRMADDLTQQTRDARAARATAERASAAKSEFLMMMSHELRTPLNAVIGFAELMNEEPFGALGDHRYRSYVRDIRASGAQLLALIDSILEVVRLDARDPVGHDNAFPIGPLVRECCDAMQPQARAGHVDLSWTVDDEKALFCGDSGLMRQILASLLSNAVKFTASGGAVAVTAAVDRERGLTLEVTDNGIGMSPLEQDRAVLMLEYSGDNMTRRHGGVGVGLTLAKLATEKQGGRLSISSAPQRGTTVEVWFPAGRLRWPGSDPVEPKPTQPIAIRFRTR
ncbi:MAG: CHASE2 domain-containing protein [Alphaproteobacteria bacterium]